MPRRLIYSLFLVLLMFASARVLAVNDTIPSVSAEQILKEASKHLGKPYHYGGKGPSSFDCAGFVRYVYGRFDIPLGPSCAPQYLAGTPLQATDLEPGDLVFFGGRKASRSIGHVGIVTSVDADNGTFEFIHAARTGVRYSNSDEAYYKERYLCACRILNGGKGTGNNRLPHYAEETALDLYFPDSNMVYNYLAGEDVNDWIRAQGKGSAWISLMPADTVHMVVTNDSVTLNEGELCQWNVQDQDGISLGTCHFSYGAHCLTVELRDSIRNTLHYLREASDILVVTFVSSNEDVGEAQTFARLCVQLGADIVCCHGASDMSMMECYEGRLILYGLGSNCHVRGHTPDNTHEIMQVRVLDDGRLQGGELDSSIHEFPSTAGGFQLLFDGSFVMP